MTKSEKVPILGFISPKTILMLRIGLKNRVGNRNHTYISFKPYFESNLSSNTIHALEIAIFFFLLETVFFKIEMVLYNELHTCILIEIISIKACKIISLI